MPSEADLGQILARLGASADEVAASLLKNGTKGIRNTVRFLNPIVRFVQRELHVDDFAPDLMQPNILRMTLPDGTTEQVALPQPVQAFLEAFNRGEYPNLELPADTD
jgi:hypothetical protein